jgi:hypothetical protein
MSTAIFSRDDVYKLVSQEDFFARNPAFAAAQTICAEGKAAYEDSAKKSRCGCGGSIAHVLPCVESVLDAAEQLKANNPEEINTLISYIREKRGDAKITGFTVYYRKSAQIPLRKIQFP